MLAVALTTAKLQHYMGVCVCRMSIIRNGNVALSNLGKAAVTLSILIKAPVALLN